MKVLNKNEKIIKPSCGCHDDCSTHVFVKSCRKNDSIVSWNGYGRSKRQARHDGSDGYDDDAHEEHDENITAQFSCSYFFHA